MDGLLWNAMMRGNRRSCYHYAIDTRKQNFVLLCFCKLQYAAPGEGEGMPLLEIEKRPSLTSWPVGEGERFSQGVNATKFRAFLSV